MEQFIRNSKFFSEREALCDTLVWQRSTHRAGGYSTGSTEKQRDDFRLLKAVAMGLHLQSVKLFAIILILARTELIFFVVAHMVLCF